jgi:hypothetical protein
MPADPMQRRRAAALSRFRTKVAVARAAKVSLARANRDKWAEAAECVRLGISKGALAREAGTTEGMVREWCAKGEQA